MKKDFFKSIKDKDIKQIFEKNYLENEEFFNYINSLNKNNYDFSSFYKMEKPILKYFKSFYLCKDLKKNCEQYFKYFRLKLVNFSNITSFELKRCKHILSDESLLLSSFEERSFPKKWILNKELDNFSIDIKNKQKTFFNSKITKNNFEKNLYIYSKDEILRKKAAAAFSILLIRLKKIKIFFIDERTLVMKIKNNWGNFLSSSNFFKKISNIDLLVIDNFGTANISTNIRDDFLFPLLLKRFNDEKLTFFVSPFKVKDIETIYKFSDSKQEIQKSFSFMKLIKKNTYFQEI